MPEKISFMDLDVTMAVQARRVLAEETNYSSSCFSLVYKPTEKLLDWEATAENFLTLICFHDEPYSFCNFPGSSVDVYIVTPGKKVAYLATIIDRAQAKALFIWHLRTYGTPDKQDKTKPQQQKSRPIDKIAVLRQRGEMAITRGRVGCKIPISSNTLYNPSLTTGVKRYMQTFVPQLADLQVVWMPNPVQKSICDFIRQKAKETAMPQTAEERERIIAQDSW